MTDDVRSWSLNVCL